MPRVWSSILIFESNLAAAATRVTQPRRISGPLRTLELLDSSISASALSAYLEFLAIRVQSALSPIPPHRAAPRHVFALMLTYDLLRAHYGLLTTPCSTALSPGGEDKEEGQGEGQGRQR